MSFQLIHPVRYTCDVCGMGVYGYSWRMVRHLDKDNPRAELTVEAMGAA